MWRQDAPYSTDPVKLPEEASRTYSDLAKYRDLKTIEVRRLREMQADANKFHFRLTKFYRDGVGDMNHPMLVEAKERGWEIPPGGAPTVKTDVKHWVDTNPDMVIITLAIAEQNDIVELIDGIISDLKSRPWSIGQTMKQVRHNNGSDF